MKTEKMDINAVCFGILCNFTPVCGEERAKEAVALIRSLQAELEQAKAERDAAIKDIPHKCWSCRNGFICLWFHCIRIEKSVSFIEKRELSINGF